ncbi:hypothetical protein ENSA5_69290 [Enhygromyxa salina]|uniref:p-hydroxylaminobenzoate lyase n=1 Tax=Enhygromyxa salina TaxID=215803 RepID=A0A2S9XAV4_9BACT|nr:DUF4863 family protein [Enhygromyxa salina]PRP89986.1 hypothetical protein ENSA5_69290 [Enhygromyxa salina]
MSTEATPSAALLELLDPILARVAALDLASCADEAQIRELEATIEREFPHAGERVQAIGRALERGVQEGWLANRGQPEARFSRVAKPGPATHGLSIDVVSMVGAGLEHTHPAGELTIGFPADMDRAPDTCQFEGRPPSWVFLGPGSRHVPRVIGERMNLIYFLPDGALQWHRP